MDEVIFITVNPAFIGPDGYPRITVRTTPAVGKNQPKGWYQLMATRVHGNPKKTFKVRNLGHQ